SDRVSSSDNCACGGDSGRCSDDDNHASGDDHNNALGDDDDYGAGRTVFTSGLDWIITSGSNGDGLVNPVPPPIGVSPDCDADRNTTNR
ncbi:MAG TPA: hypothetical protein VNT52_13890, partial [Acidimicrobiales bacterium]|nr:hypothetical protein [Acidimicrobiales bacterium]